MWAPSCTVGLASRCDRRTGVASESDARPGARALAARAGGPTAALRAGLRPPRRGRSLAGRGRTARPHPPGIHVDHRPDGARLLPGGPASATSGAGPSPTSLWPASPDDCGTRSTVAGSPRWGPVASATTPSWPTPTPSSCWPRRRRPWPGGRARGRWSTRPPQCSTRSSSTSGPGCTPSAGTAPGACSTSTAG